MVEFVVIFAVILLGVLIYSLILLNRQKKKAEDDLRDKKRKGVKNKLSDKNEAGNNSQ